MNHQTDIDELRLQWQALDVRQARLESARLAAKGRSWQDRAMRHSIFEAAAGGLCALFAGGFLADHFSRALSQPLLALPALVVWLTGVAAIGSAVAEVVNIRRIDLSQPVAEAAAAVLQWRRARVRATQVMLASLLPVWMAFPIFALQALGGWEAAVAHAPWVTANVLFGLAVGIGLLVGAKHGRGPFWRGLEALLAGREAQEAEALLAQARQFSRP